MSRFIVSIPVAGSITFEVEALDEAGAIAAAWGAYGDDELRDQADLAWEAMDRIVEGNVLHFEGATTRGGMSPPRVFV